MMGQVLVRNLDDTVIERLKGEAARGTPLERVARETLAAADDRQARAARIEALRAQVLHGPVPHHPDWDPAALIRDWRDDNGSAACSGPGGGRGGQGAEVRPVVRDASVILARLVEEEHPAGARRLPGGRAPLLAPATVPAKAAHAPPTRIRQGQPTPAGSPEAPLHGIRYGGTALTGDVLLLDSATAIAKHLPHPIHDCPYLAPCRREEATPATFDAGLARHATTLATPLWSPDTSP